MIKMRPIQWVLLCLLASSASLCWAAKSSFYKWTDENGVTHYSEYKPHDKVTEKIDIRTGQATPDEESANTNQGSDNAVESVAQNNGENEKIKDPERCDAARQNLETLNGYTRIRTKDPDSGEIRYLTENEKTQKRKDAEKAIDESC